MADSEIISATARFILFSFEIYLSEFFRVTRRAKRRFELRDWRGRHRDASVRLNLYGQMLERVTRNLKGYMCTSFQDRTTWAGIKVSYLGLIERRYDQGIVKTFFNSVTRRVFSTVGLDREIEYFDLEPTPAPDPPCESICRRYAENRPTREIVTQILNDHGFEVEFEDIERDSELVAREIDLRLWPNPGSDRVRAIEVVNAAFYRNKAAYLVGRIISDGRIAPMVLPLYNGERGVYVDTVLLSEAEVNTVFDFAFSYFHVDSTRHDALIGFLQSILPEKPLAELYASIGFDRHAKTEFYRNLHRFVHESHEKFVIAPGKEGAVMIVFTLPDFNYVFKVIKDRPYFLRGRESVLKTVAIDRVREKYNLVCHRDRVGRMVDTQEFENLRFRRKRFFSQLLREFSSAASESVSIDGEYVIIRHLYVQRKVTPLPIYLMEEKDPEAIRRIIIDFGYFLKDLAATGIFPGDLFDTWNYGVTPSCRVVLFDYDDVMPLESVNFLEKPRPRDETQEMAPEENWIVADRTDYFPDEFYKHTGIPEHLKGIFRDVHQDLLTIRYWSEMKSRLRKGEIVDITPYDSVKKFARKGPAKDAIA
jgi:isocitrate dehydrogenase kinase/phosphatase